MENRHSGKDKSETRHLTESVDEKMDLPNSKDTVKGGLDEDKKLNKPSIIIENGFHDSNGSDITKKYEKTIIPIGKQEMSPFEVAQQLNKMNLQTNLTSKSTQADTAPTAYFNKDLQTECLLHKVQGRDTIQGIALKYGVEVAELKKVNKIWANNDLFARRDLIIPISLENYLAFQSKQSTSGTRNTVPPKGIDRRQEMIKKFIEIAHCEQDIALHYLEEKKWNFTKALGFYFSEQENKVFVKPNGTTAPIVALDDLEVWTNDASREKKLQEFEEMTIHAISGPANVTRLNRKTQEKFEKEEDAMFDL